MVLSCIHPFEDGLIFDCNIWVPSEKYCPISSEDESSSYSYTYEDSDMDSFNAFTGELEEASISSEQRRNALHEKIDEGELEANFFKLANGGKTIKAKDAAMLARRSGLAPSIQDEQRLAQEEGDKVSYEKFSEWLLSVTHVEDSVDQLCKFFEHYDTLQSGCLSYQQITLILSAMGEPLSDEELSKLFPDKPSAKTNINYRELAEKLLKN